MKPELVLERIHTGERSLDSYKKKVHLLRRMVAGDQSAMMSRAGGAQDPDSTRNDDYFDIFVNDVVTGRSNKLLQAVRAQVMQTASQFPELEIKGCNAQAEAINESYFRIRMGNAPMGCNAQEHMRLAIFDFVTGGMGWGQVGFRDNKPGIFHADTLDMVWDQSCKVMSEMQWAACKTRQPLWYWKKLYGSAVKMSPKTEENEDELVELVYYYDVIDGGHRVILNPKGAEPDKPIKNDKNPFFYEVQGEEVPFLPYESASMMLLPSVRLPYGVVEQMLPAQLAIHQAEDYIADVIERCKGHFEAEEGTYEPETWDRLVNGGEIGLALKRRTGHQPGTWTPPEEPPRSVYEWLQQNERSLTEQSGNNPYVSGNPIGPEFASEVAAIEGNAGLMASSIAKVNAMLWERLASKFLATGALYDNGFITIRDIPVPGSTASIDIDFGPDNPVSVHLRPDAVITVREDSMRYASRQQKVAEAQQKLQFALTVMQVYPKGVEYAWRGLLEALGEHNVEKWLAQDAPVMPPMPGQGSPPGEVAQKQAISGAIQGTGF